MDAYKDIKNILNDIDHVPSGYASMKHTLDEERQDYKDV